MAETMLEQIPERFLGFYSLRKCEMNAGRVVSEQIYIHSKVMIVDDSIAVIGSANLNDRSMLGTRDSEVALVVSNSTMARELRLNLFKEHLGENMDDFHDEKWSRIARRNTQILEGVFQRQLPSNACRVFDDFEQEKGNYAEGPFEQGWQGHLVEFPIHFLSNESNLLPRVVRLEREGAVPFENFT